MGPGTRTRFPGWVIPTAECDLGGEVVNMKIKRKKNEKKNKIRMKNRIRLKVKVEEEVGVLVWSGKMPQGRGGARFQKKLCLSPTLCLSLLEEQINPFGSQGFLIGIGRAHNGRRIINLNLMSKS